MDGNHFNSGIIIQYGNAIDNTGGVTFPISYTSRVSVTTAQEYIDQDGDFIEIYQVNINKFNWWTVNYHHSKINWIAIGY